MKDIWYADKRDLIKWGVLLRLASLFDAERILQVAYYRYSDWKQKQILINDRPFEIPQEVISHFRDIRSVSNINSKQERCVVFLDPDTGLEPQNSPKLDHVLESEVSDIWEAMEMSDLLVLYQHQTNRNGQPWIEPKRNQLAEAIDIPTQSIKIAEGSSIAKDVVFLYAQKV